MVQVSVVVTVFNEESSIDLLLQSLVFQSKKASEIIIVDAGSTDKTVKNIIRFGKKYQQVTLIQAPGVNRSQGRNRGIHRAKSKFIAITDAGCIPQPNWLETLTEPFSDPAIDVVSGYYESDAQTPFQKSFAVFTIYPNYKVKDDTYLPSSRSLAFTKVIWKKVGGYPAHLDTCEDLVFVEHLKKANARFRLSKDAIVSWKQEHTWPGAFVKLFSYSRGDGQARYRPHLKRAAFVWLRYAIGIWLLIVFPVSLMIFIPQYIAWSIGKGYSRVKDIQALWLLPLLQITADIAVMSGSTFGLIEGLFRDAR